MENKRQVSGSSSSSSSSSVSLDHLFGPKDSSSSSSSTSGIFGTIFPPPSTVLGRNSSHPGMMGSWNNQGLPHHGKYGNPDHTTDSKGQSCGTTNKDKSTSSIYQNESVEPCYFSSSIYYGGQENYSPRKKTTESPHYFKKDGRDGDPNGSNSSGASRGNWWQVNYSLFVQAHFITNISIQNNANLPSQYCKDTGSMINLIITMEISS
ncbi:hypothetical protein CRYUN_Cryun05aG0155200 [Craigia yunnanensis]